MTSKVLIPFFLLFFIAACGDDEAGLPDESLSLAEQIDRLIENDQYETALTRLENENRDDAEVRLLLEKIHLNFGLHSMTTFDAGQMRTRMNNALVQFTEVLKLNPENTVAREQVHQIMGVYATIPDRSPDEHVLEGLREIGFDY